MTPPRIFTIEEVNALIPELTALVGAQLTKRRDIEDALRELSEHLEGEVPHDLTPAIADNEVVTTMKRSLAGRLEEYQRGWGRIEELGGVVKDARVGLIDFYGRVDDALVWLCWRLGEKEVMHYHALHESFSDRRELRGSMKIRHLN